MLVIGILANIFLMDRFSRKVIANQSSQSIEQIGNNLVYRILSRMRGYEAILKSIAVVSGQAWENSAQLDATITNILQVNRDTRIRAVRIIAPKTGEGKAWQRTVSERWDLQPIENESVDQSSWIVIGQGLEEDQTYWNQADWDQDTHEAVVTAVFKSRQSSGEDLIVAMDIKLTGLNTITEKWEKEIEGSYIFITDQSNHFLIRSKRIQEYHGDSKEIKTTRDFSTKEPLFKPIEDKLYQMTDIVLKAAKEMPDFKENSVEKFQFSKGEVTDYAKLTAAIVMDPLIRLTFSERYLIDQDVIIKESASLYTFFVPETYWKLAIVVPAKYENAVADEVTRVFYILWIVGAIALIFFSSLLLNRFLVKPINEFSYHMDVINNSVEKSNWSQLKKLVNTPEPNSELGTVQSKVSKLLESLINLREENKKDVDRLEQELRNVQNNRDKILDRCEKLDIENRERKKQMDEALEQQGDKDTELAEHHKENEEALYRMVRNLKGLRIQLIPIWDAVLYVPHVVNLLQEDWQRELERLLDRCSNSHCKYLVISLAVFPFDDKALGAKRVLEIKTAVEMIGIQCLYVSMPPTVVSAFIQEKNLVTTNCNFRNIREALVHIWKVEEAGVHAQKSQMPKNS